MTRYAPYCVAALVLWRLGGGSTALMAQVFEVRGGASSLYQASGGSVTVQSAGYDFTVGAGTVDGHLMEGGRVLKATQHGTWVLGDDRIDFQLPTDIFDITHFVQARGLGFSGVRHDLDVVAFAGGMSSQNNSPFFDGAKWGNPVGLFFLKKKVSSHWQFYSDTLASKQLTAIEAVQWSPVAKTEVSVAGGVGANEPFGAVSFKMSRARVDVQASYIAAGKAFQRAATSTLVIPEPDRENIVMTVRPFHLLTLSGSRQNFLVPQLPVPGAQGAPLSAQSSINQGSASLHLLGAQINGTVYRSTYTPPGELSASDHAVALFVGRDLTRRLHWSSMYLVSKPQGAPGTRTFNSVLTESLTARLAVNANVLVSNGNTSVNFGGQFLSNRLSVSATYDTYYVPAQNNRPFEQALLLDVKLKFLGRLVVHGASYVDPTGRIRSTIDANSVLTHEQNERLATPVTLGRYVLAGCVVDGRGASVEGAAVLIDEKPLYTDSTGCFSLRESSPRTHRLRVVIAEFLVGGNWQVTSMPMTVTSTTEEKSEEMKVVVVVRRVREVSSSPDLPDHGGDGEPVTSP